LPYLLQNDVDLFEKKVGASFRVDNTVVGRLFKELAFVVDKVTICCGLLQNVS
jgi:hypothetical protein